MGLNSEEPTEPNLGMIECQLVEEPVTAISDSGVNAQSSELVIATPEVVMVDKSGLVYHKVVDSICRDSTDTPM